MREKYTRFSLADDAEFGQCVMTRSVLSECETKQLEKQFIVITSLYAERHFSI